MARQRVVNMRDVVSFAPGGAEGRYESRLLVDGEGLGSQNVIVNHFTLKAGHKTDAGRHPAPYEEVYYVLRGEGVLTLEDPEPEGHEVGPDTVAYIPADCNHWIENTGAEDLEMITIMPFHPRSGVNSFYDERKEKWGRTFRLMGE